MKRINLISWVRVNAFDTMHLLSNLQDREGLTHNVVTNKTTETRAVDSLGFGTKRSMGDNFSIQGLLTRRRRQRFEIYGPIILYQAKK